MDINKKNKLKIQILEKYNFYKKKYSKVEKIIKFPLKTINYFSKNFIAHIKPFKVKYRTLWGDKMCLFLPWDNGLYYYDYMEANLTNFFINFIEAGDIVFDVGANIGYYTLLASFLVGEKGGVYSFEPTTRTFNILNTNTKFKKNIIINNTAISQEEGETEFLDYGPKFNTLNSLNKRDDSIGLPTPKKIMVKVVSLDNYSIKNNINPNFIKIDVEGAEYLVLSSMSNILKEDQLVVSIEVGGGNEWKENCHKSIKLLEDNGFSGYEINDEGYLKPHIKKESYEYDNLIFIKRNNRRLNRLLINNIRNNF